LEDNPFPPGYKTHESKTEKGPEGFSIRRVIHLSKQE
jgi:hypothetical protein